MKKVLKILDLAPSASKITEIFLRINVDNVEKIGKLAIQITD